MSIHSFIFHGLVAELAGIDLLDVLTGGTLGLLAVDEVQTLALDLTVNESTSEAGHELLGLLVARGLT
jgi:hypothetical protein